MRPVRALVVASLIALSAACGGGSDGGGGGGGSAPPAVVPPSVGASPTCTGSEAFSAVADATVTVGKMTGAVVAGCNGPLADVLWTQTAGPTVALLSARTQAISFEAPSAGVYAFAVTFRDAGGVTQTANVSTTVIAGSADVLARVDQAVRKGGNVSLRAWPAAASGDTLTWTQTAGPQVTLDTADPNRVLFVAPEVSRDTALVFRVTRRTTTGVTDTDDVFVLVENYAQAPTTGPFLFGDAHVSRVYPYHANGPFAAALVRCTFDSGLFFATTTNTCPLATLPYLHQTTGGAVPSVSQIMDRVVVSHDWMGQVFEDFLTTQANDDIKRLLNGVTAIVIGAQVRPSFYFQMTGAIYLDADNFWLTAEQRDVINETPDFRSDFDRDLMYSGVWRYTEGADSIFVSFPATSRIGRSLGYLLAETGWLLYHELAHASDFVPPSERARLNANLALTPWDFVRTVPTPSVQLENSFPLTSQEMRGLAQVKFHGATATAEQRAYTPDAVAAFFAADRATDEYNYSSRHEDLAMVFEEFMMFRNHGWRRDVAITDKIGGSTTSANLIVRWGQRGRVGATTVKPRAELAVAALAPWVAPTEVQNLPTPIQMRPGESWAGNLVLPSPPALASANARRLLDFESERALLLRGLVAQRAATPRERWTALTGR